MAKSNSTKNVLTAVGYCRTSGEGQRNNTSIPRQKDEIASFCKRHSLHLDQCYVDESKSGSKIAGRDAFQQMMRDAANGIFQTVVVYDLTRFARDGFDIINSARTLKRDFGVDVLDTKNQFDTRDRRHVLTNYVAAGVAEDERLRIMDRTASGRIRKAAAGEPWSGDPPFGRAYDKNKRRWYITEKGKLFQKLLNRYMAGEGTAQLERELGIRAVKVSQLIHHGQLAGQYKARFNYQEIDIDVEVPVPGMPEIIPMELLERAKARMAFNRTNNRRDLQKYYLTGFLRCAQCGRTLSGRCPHKRRTYYHGNRSADCILRTVPSDEIESKVFNLLYRAFLDRPAFDDAVKRALPSPKDRQKIEKEITSTDKLLDKNKRQAERLVDAIAKGADVGLLLGKQEAIKTEREALQQRLNKLESELASLPSRKETELAIAGTLDWLRQEQHGKDWRKIPFDDVRRFLLHLFGETTVANGNGIFLEKDAKGRFKITLKGRIFQAGKPLTANLSARNAHVRATESECSSSPPA